MNTPETIDRRASLVKKSAIVAAAAAAILVPTACGRSMPEHPADGKKMFELNGKEYFADGIVAMGLRNGATLYSAPTGTKGREMYGQVDVSEEIATRADCHPSSALNDLLKADPAATIFPHEVNTIYHTSDDVGNVGFSAKALLSCVQTTLKDKLNDPAVNDTIVWVDANDITSIYDPQG